MLQGTFFACVCVVIEASQGMVEALGFESLFDHDG